MLRLGFHTRIIPFLFLMRSVRSYHRRTMLKKCGNAAVVFGFRYLPAIGNIQSCHVDAILSWGDLPLCSGVKPRPADKVAYGKRKSFNSREDVQNPARFLCCFEFVPVFEFTDHV
jgi:hypothetical protein